MHIDDPKQYLAATAQIESDDPQVIAFARSAAGDARDEIEIACNLYYATRDGIRYDPYYIELTEEGLSAKSCLKEKVGFCVTKAALLAAACRAVGIPARVGYADVRNHLVTGKLAKMMGTDLFVYHGYADIYLDGRWVKATPVFNLALCEKFRVLPLEFNGREDSLFQPFNADNKRHMDYVQYRGTYANVPVKEIAQGFKDAYPSMFDGDRMLSVGDFAAEAEAETKQRNN
jgi:transglutaminase-like putative cysteine protease